MCRHLSTRPHSPSLPGPREKPEYGPDYDPGASILPIHEDGTACNRIDRVPDRQTFGCWSARRLPGLSGLPPQTQPVISSFEQLAKIFVGLLRRTASAAATVTGGILAHFIIQTTEAGIRAVPLGIRSMCLRFKAFFLVGIGSF